MAKSNNRPKKKISAPVVTVAEMPSGRTFEFEINFDKDQRAKGAAQLGLLDLQKLRFIGTLSPRGKSDWVLEGALGATAIQACVVSLEPVKTRVDEPVRRVFEADWQEPDAESVSEMDEDVESEPLDTIIDLELIALEAIALALPDYPRKEDVALEETVFAQDGVKPMTDDDAKPFAGLAALKEKLEKDG